jgi:hypothetical protein
MNCLISSTRDHEAGIGVWTSGVSLDAKAIVEPDSELTEIQFELTVDHLHYRKAIVADTTPTAPTGLPPS